MQELQGDKNNLEKQLKTIKQERNALAATLRQHGFLGKQSRSSTAVQSSGCEQQQQQNAQADLCRQGAYTGNIKRVAVCESTTRATLGSPGSHQQAHEANEPRAVPCSGSNAANASHIRHPCEARCLRDTTNATVSTAASPAAKSSSYAVAHMHQVHQSHHEPEMVTSSVHSIQDVHEAQAMQAKLFDLERLAQELLL